MLLTFYCGFVLVVELYISSTWWRHKNVVITSFKLNLSQIFPYIYEVATKNFKFGTIDLTLAISNYWGLFVNKFDSKVDLIQKLDVKQKGFFIILSIQNYFIVGEDEFEFLKYF